MSFPKVEPLGSCRNRAQNQVVGFLISNPTSGSRNHPPETELRLTASLDRAQSSCMVLAPSASGSPSFISFPFPASGGLLPTDRTEVLTAGGQPAGLTQGLVSRACNG